MGIKMPYDYKCPNCGYDGHEGVLDYGGNTEAWGLGDDELPSWKFLSFGCPKCGQMFDVEFKIQYTLDEVRTKGFDEDVVARINNTVTEDEKEKLYDLKDRLTEAQLEIDDILEEIENLSERERTAFDEMTVY